MIAASYLSQSYCQVVLLLVCVFLLTLCCVNATFMVSHDMVLLVTG